MFSQAAYAQPAAPSFVKDGHITVCTTAGFPPFTYMDKPTDARPVGVDIDVADALAKLWGADITFVVSGFDGLLPSLQAGRCSLVISGIYLSDKRRQSYDGAPYLKSSTVIVAAAGNDTIKTPEDLSGKSLAIEAGTSYADTPDELNKKFKADGKAPVTFQTYESQVAATQQVIIGRADATLTEAAEAGVRIKQTGGQIKVVYTFPSEFKFGIYIQKSPKDLELLRSALKTLSQQGTFEAIAGKYNFPKSGFDVDFDS
ncbi:transporter substrate-binding domain-containing protein [Mesorhizobium sp. INR15]|uniref:transporter substrate-binding domain-containing protein n=1 Tax=Mesorhizobium sp. INR15 TaxID=2654248 RepID=UPI0018965715|nr:transporter substrate-binding domain-containing protein [Mesorhizobium sp. INR15]